MTPEAAAWLREQVLARRALAEAAIPVHGETWHVEGDLRPFIYGKNPGRPVGEVTNLRLATHVAANDPADTIARCEAELGILDLWDIWKGNGGVELLDDAVEHLAGGYRHHEGWDAHFGSEVRT